MVTFHVIHEPPVKVTPVCWEKLPNGNWQSGNVQIRLVAEWFTGDYRHTSWGIWLQVGRQWIQVHVKTRPWYYGSAGQAKIGVTHTNELTFGKPTKGRQ